MFKATIVIISLLSGNTEGSMSAKVLFPDEEACHAILDRDMPKFQEAFAKAGEQVMLQGKCEKVEDNSI